jgi:hypothetical protein
MCIMKKDNLLVYEDVIDDFDDLILGNIGEVVFVASKTFGVSSIEIELPNRSKMVLDKPLEDPICLFYDRLIKILDSAKLISEQNNISYNVIAAELLVLDGWSWNDIIFRAPIWMFDHREIIIEEARKIKGLEWLTGTSLEIKLKQNMVSGGLGK